MKCEEVDGLISDYSAGFLGGRTEMLVREHLDDCHTCARELAKLEVVLRAVEEEMAEIEPPRGLWHGVSNRIAGAGPRQSWTGRVGRLVAGPRRTFAFGAAAAALAVALFLGVPRNGQPPMPVPEPAAIGYVQDHAAAASDGAFADRVSMGFVASMSTDGSQRPL